MISRRYIEAAGRKAQKKFSLAVPGMSLIAISLVIFISAAASGSSLQEKLPPPPLPVDPTPLDKLITGREQEELRKSTKPKRLVETYLKISKDHLEAAVVAVKSEEMLKAERELDIYGKAMAECARVAFSQQKERRQLTKKMEQSLYRHIRMLEGIEALFPIERVGFLERAVKQAKQLRVQALNETFAAGDVLADPAGENKPPEQTVPSKDGRPMTPSRFVPNHFMPAPQRSSSSSPADYMTEEEDDVVRVAQAPDDRIKVFMKIADRRLAGLTAAPPPPTDKKAQQKIEEEERKWGALPKVGRAVLLRHYARAVDEAIAKLEDAYERNPKSSALPKALSHLRDATDRHLQTLRALQPELKDDNEQSAWREAMEQAEVANKGAREGLKK